MEGIHGEKPETQSLCLKDKKICSPEEGGELAGKPKSRLAYVNKYRFNIRQRTI